MNQLHTKMHPFKGCFRFIMDISLNHSTYSSKLNNSQHSITSTNTRHNVFTRKQKTLLLKNERQAPTPLYILLFCLSSNPNEAATFGSSNFQLYKHQLVSIFLATTRGMRQQPRELCSPLFHPSTLIFL